MSERLLSMFRIKSFPRRWTVVNFWPSRNLVKSFSPFFTILGRQTATSVIFLLRRLLSRSRRMVSTSGNSGMGNLYLMQGEV